MMAKIATRLTVRVVGLRRVVSCRVRLKKTPGTKVRACVRLKVKKLVVTADVVQVSRATTVVIGVVRRVAMRHEVIVQTAHVRLVAVMDGVTMIAVVHVRHGLKAVIARRAMRVVSVQQDALTRARSGPLIGHVKTECVKTECVKIGRVKIGRRVLSGHRRRSLGSSATVEQVIDLRPSVVNVRRVIATVSAVSVRHG